MLNVLCHCACSLQYLQSTAQDKHVCVQTIENKFFVPYKYDDEIFYCKIEFVDK